MCDLDDLEPFEFCQEIERKARKPHICDLCHGPISRGQLYLQHRSKFDGQITSEKLCSACIDDRKIFSDAHDGQFTSPSATRDLIHECISASNPKEEQKWRSLLNRINKRKLPPPPEKKE